MEEVKKKPRNKKLSSSVSVGGFPRKRSNSPPPVHKLPLKSLSVKSVDFSASVISTSPPSVTFPKSKSHSQEFKVNTNKQVRHSKTSPSTRKSPGGGLGKAGSRRSLPAKVLPNLSNLPTLAILHNNSPPSQRPKRRPSKGDEYMSPRIKKQLTPTSESIKVLCFYFFFTFIYFLFIISFFTKYDHRVS